MPEWEEGSDILMAGCLVTGKSGYNPDITSLERRLMTHLCKDAKKAALDAEKASERKAEGKAYYICRKCGRASHNEEHLCKPEKVK